MERVLASLAALLSALFIANAAWAHATLLSSEPADGSVLAQAPKMVQLHFNEGVTPAVIGLIDAGGKARDVASRAVGQSILIVLPEDLPQGTQIVSYRVVSQDGHPVAGSLVFSIGAVTGAAPPAKTSPLALLIWLARIGVYLGLFVGVGGAFFAAWIGQGPSGSTVSRGALAIGLVSAVASLGLQGLDLLNLPLRAIVTSAPWTSALATSLGPSLLIAIVVMAIAWFAWQSPSILISRVLTTLAMAGVGLSLAASGHAATASPQWLTRPSLLLHGIAAAYWIGALAPLAAMARQRRDDLPRVLKQFSALALPLVGLLVLSGLVLSIIQVGSWRALIETQYGIILSIKLTLVILLLGLAALNRFLFTPAVVARDENNRPLLRSILIECVLVVCILAVVATWRFTPPPRASVAPAATPLSVHIHTDAAMFQVLVSPGRVGANDFVLQLMTGDAALLPAKEATLILSLPERGIEPMERRATLGPDGYWHVRGVALPLPGRWRMQIDALVTDFQKITLQDDLQVR
ncbi:copper resistance CopC/CopD family protein [Bradyrhizobium valentinum]|uniref:Copper-binding protein n=1 Tax=Bradyrhizobium valentinum TaxID=1518501 RepID=A0A0R3KZ64_9BRAD|nr:CopD family protein [Bradyrhizobium valentinum]KRR00571.1 copper-binding protein [Bradyrhizobium valentinum]KRR11440.1 copper-binding protein [Bradyrhizobium valentinum]